jgi:hypothetical protein
MMNTTTDTAHRDRIVVAAETARFTTNRCAVCAAAGPVWSDGRGMDTHTGCQPASCNCLCNELRRTITLDPA